MMTLEAKYILLHGSDTDEVGRSSPCSVSLRWFMLTGLNILLFLSSCVLFLQKRDTSETEGDVSSKLAQTEQLPVITRNHYWWTEYSEKNETEVDKLWDEILPSHGFIAVDESWAVSSQWPTSMRLPQDRTKRVYLLEGYHQLHCLTIIRKTFWQLAKGEPTTYHVTHAGHCFDAIRQNIQCQADNTPLYTFGDKTAGDGQLHRCRSWDVLRDFATKHSACYRDSVTDIPLGEHFGFCDDGWDGMKDALPANVTFSTDA